MPVGRLNNGQTADGYVDSLTVKFPYPRRGFSMQVSNAAIYYQVATATNVTNLRDANFEHAEHFTQPALLTFREPLSEGFSPDSLFTGIRVRSAVSGTPASVTVHA